MEYVVVATFQLNYFLIVLEIFRANAARLRRIFAANQLAKRNVSELCASICPVWSVVEVYDVITHVYVVVLVYGWSQVV